MLLSLQGCLQTQYWDGFLQNPLLSLLMDKTSTRSRSSWIQIGWESISNTRSHMRDMGRNTMNGYSEMTYLRISVQNPLRTTNRSSMPNIPQRNITRMTLRSERKDEDLSRRDKKTYSET